MLSPLRSVSKFGGQQVCRIDPIPGKGPAAGLVSMGLIAAVKWDCGFHISRSIRH